MALLFRYSSMNVEGTLTFIFSDRYGIQSSLFLNFCKCILQNVLLFVFSLHHAYTINNILKLNHASIKHAIIKYLFTKQKKFLDIRPQIKYFQLCHLITIIQAMYSTEPCLRGYKGIVFVFLSLLFFISRFPQTFATFFQTSAIPLQRKFINDKRV